MKTILTVLSLALTSFATSGSYAQNHNAIQWQFSVAKKSSHESMLIMTAQLAPGWHLYSQFMAEGGPMPTSFTFHPGNDFLVSGKPEEKGNPVQFHDEIYDMDITWYAAQVSFLQRIRLLQPAATISGSIAYMICNHHSCVPGKQDFSITISP